MALHINLWTLKWLFTSAPAPAVSSASLQSAPRAAASRFLLVQMQWRRRRPLHGNPPPPPPHSAKSYRAQSEWKWWNSWTRVEATFSTQSCFPSDWSTLFYIPLWLKYTHQHSWIYNEPQTEKPYCTGDVLWQQLWRMCCCHITGVASLNSSSSRCLQNVLARRTVSVISVSVWKQHVYHMAADTAEVLQVLMDLMVLVVLTGPETKLWSVLGQRLSSV